LHDPLIPDGRDNCTKDEALGGFLRPPHKLGSRGNR